MTQTLAAQDTYVLVTGGAGFIGSHTVVEPVSYTHLDVYKRQAVSHS